MVNASRKVLVVDIEAPQGVTGTTTRSDLRKEHLRLLAQRARNTKSPLEYHRLFQVADPSLPVQSAIADPVLVEHCRAMRELADKTSGRVSFKLAPKMFPYGWILIDDETLVLELYRLRPGDYLPSYERSLLVHDPQGSLVEAFMSLWRELAGQQQNRWPELTEF